MSNLIHTCYRITDIDRSVAFYEALGFEEVGRIPIRDEAINVFMNLPGDGDMPRLELTYNFGVDSYDLGTGLRPHRDHRRRSRRDARAARRPGHRAREAALHRARGRLAPVLRARPGRLPDRADREAQRRRAALAAARRAVWPRRRAPRGCRRTPAPAAGRPARGRRSARPCPSRRGTAAAGRAPTIVCRRGSGAVARRPRRTSRARPAPAGPGTVISPTFRNVFVSVFDERAQEVVVLAVDDVDQVDAAR